MAASPIDGWMLPSTIISDANAEAIRPYINQSTSWEAMEDTVIKFCLTPRAKGGLGLANKTGAYAHLNRCAIEVCKHLWNTLPEYPASVRSRVPMILVQHLTWKKAYSDAGTY